MVRPGAAPSGLAGGLFGRFEKRSNLERAAGDRVEYEVARGQRAEARHDHPTLAEDPRAAKRSRHATAGDADKSRQVARSGVDPEVVLHVPTNFPLVGYLKRIQEELRVVVARREPLIPPEHLLSEPRDSAEPALLEAVDALGEFEEPGLRCRQERQFFGRGSRQPPLSPITRAAPGTSPRRQPDASNPCTQRQEELLALPPYFGSNDGRSPGSRDVLDDSRRVPLPRRLVQDRQRDVVRSPARHQESSRREFHSPQQTSPCRQRFGGTTRPPAGICSPSRPRAGMRSPDPSKAGLCSPSRLMAGFRSPSRPSRGEGWRRDMAASPIPRRVIDDSPDTDGPFFDRGRQRSRRPLVWDSPPGSRAASPRAVARRGPSLLDFGLRLGHGLDASPCVQSPGVRSPRAQGSRAFPMSMAIEDRAPCGVQVSGRNWDFTSDLTFLTGGG